MAKAKPKLCTLNEFLTREVGRVTPRIGVPETGVGLRARIPLTFRNGTEDWYFEFFSEIVLPDQPTDDMGFVLEDAKIFDGVQMMLISGTSARTKLATGVGVVYRYKQFLRKIGTDKILKLKLNHVMDNLRHMTFPKEDYIRKINELWVNREPGAESLLGPVYRC